MMQKITAHFSSTMQKIIRRCWMSSACILLILAILFSIFRGLTPWVKQYKSQFETQLSSWVGQKVSIRDIQTSWYWFTPVLKIEHLSLVDSQQEVLALGHLMIGINLWHSLWHWQIKPGVLYVDDVHLTMKQTADTWIIKGLDAQTPNAAVSEHNFLQILGLLLSQDKVVIKHFSANIRLANGTAIPLQSLNLKIIQRAGHHRISGNAELATEPRTSVALIADLTLDTQQVSQSSGQMYFSLKNADLRFWQTFFPASDYSIGKGNGDGAFWLDLVHGQLTKVQALVHLSDVTVTAASKIKHIPRLEANLAWKKNKDNWRLTADQISLHMKGIDWAHNKIMLSYAGATPRYQAYIQELSLEALRALDLPWPSSLQALLALQPTGKLQDMQLAWQYGDLDYFLTRFTDLSWRASKDLPGLTHLFGALYWQPSEGRLELDGEHTTLTPADAVHLSPITLDIFNTACDWKVLSQGLRLSMERLVISHPHLLVSATGAIDNPLHADANVRLNVDFAAKSGQYWLPYIPSAGLKPKFDEWLKHDIPRIEHVSGHMHLSGPWADFPFDNGTGEFTIAAHASGVDILVNPSWPMNRDIDADLEVNKRRFTANVDQATLEGVTVQDVNLVVPDIGLGKEVFLLHGQIAAPGPQIKSYVFHSPLRQSFARWRSLAVEGILGLDLQIEVPLYPESDRVLALGQLHFNNNNVAIQAVDNPAEFTAVKGQLAFNDYGLTAGSLEGLLLDYPFTVQVEPLTGPKAGTELRFEGEVATEYLQHLVHLPLWSFVQGQLIVTGLWTVYPNDSDLDKLYLNSSLAGVAIDLPRPFGKAMGEIMPVTVNMAFHPEHRIDLNLNYGQDIQAKIIAKQTAQGKWIETGDIHLGSGAIDHPEQSGLRIIGTIADLDMEDYRRVLQRLSPESSGFNYLDNLRDVDILVAKTSLAGQSYPHLHVTAHQDHGKNWSGSIKQQNFAGTFHYHTRQHNLEAHLDHLYWGMPSASPSPNNSPWILHPSSLPNCNLTIDDFSYNGLGFGQIIIKTTSGKKQWTLNDWTVMTPDYQLSMTGTWREDNQKAYSSIQGQLRLKNLAKILTRWDITPAIDAHAGQVNFEGHWHQPFYDFSLQHLVGQMHLSLKDGRISHLDRETEEKLGLGKLLSILSLQTIPRRLKLDFSDLSEKGYTFDIFKGNFQVNQGVMTTDDTYLDGPVAFAKMTGDLDLVKHLYDVDLRISPYIGASLPVVATLAGGPVAGPVAGVATWVALKIINQGMQKINAYTYKISGPWLHPVVQQVSIVRSKN